MPNSSFVQSPLIDHDTLGEHASGKGDYVRPVTVHVIEYFYVETVCVEHVQGELTYLCILLCGFKTDDHVLNGAKLTLRPNPLFAHQT
jgi:hypothetical protein